MGLTIGVDIGGTKVLGGVVDDDGRIVTRIRKPTPASTAEGVADAVAAVVEEARSTYPVEAVGIGAAGFVDASRSLVRFAPNIAFRDTPLCAMVEERVGLPAVVENDANAAAWAEYRFGGGRGHSHVVCVTLGTGVGGGFVFDGHLFRGGYGAAAEIGHMQVVPGPAGRPCGCGQTGCLEQYTSGRALVRRAREAAQAAPEEAAALLAAAGGTADGIEGPMVTAAAQAGDAFARRVLAEHGADVGQGLADLAAFLDPTCFVIGGGVSEAGDLLLEPARRTYREVLSGGGHRPMPDIVAAELGNDAGLIGAADLARQPD